MNFTVKNKTSLLFYAAVAVLITVLALYYVNTQKVKTTSDLVTQTQEVLRKSDEVLLDVLNIETGARGYILTGNTLFLEPFSKAILTVNDNIKALKTLTKDNPIQQVRIDTMMQTGSIRTIEITKILAAKRTNTLTETQKNAFITEGLLMTSKIKERIAAIKSEEFSLLKQRKSDYENSDKNAQFAFLGLLFSIIGISVLVAIILNNQKTRHKDLETFNASQKLLSNYSLSLIEASLDPLVTINTEGKITDMNEAMVTITGIDREILRGSDFSLYFTEPQKAREVYQEVFEKGFVIDHPLTMKDGKPTDVLFNGSVYKDEQGNVLGAVVVARDVTEKKRIETELLEAKIYAELATSIAEEAQKKAEIAVKSKQQFLSNMSHEIRTPLNGIIGFTKVVLKTDLTAKQKEYLTAIKMSGDALIVLINDILDLAKVDAGKMTFEKTPFKLSSSLSAMLHLFETKIQEKNLVLIKEYDTKIPDVLVGDPIRLHQIILNLVSNAMKFTTEGRITVSVRLLSETAENVAIQFAVADTGIGIPKDKLEKIFENFQQASSNTTRLYGGTGLGLAIAKQLVETQGGTIQVESTVDKGSNFSFILNFDKTDAEAEVVTDILEVDKDIKNIKVLVVEDMPLNQLLMKTILDDFGFERDIADNGKIAIEKLKTKSYDVILMDLQMPEMNGFEATEYIRNTLKLKVPIVALTADVTSSDVARCKAVGMNDYVAKPVDERLLYSKIVGLVKKPASLLAYKENGVATLKKIKYTNMEYLIQRTKANPALMLEIIAAYLEQTPPLVNSMKQSFHSQDWDTLHAAVHKMIPSFAIMGISTDFETMAKKVMEHAKMQQDTHNILDFVAQLESVCLQACEELTAELDAIKNAKTSR